jgi:hypothetical protein
MVLGFGQESPVHILLYTCILHLPHSLLAHVWYHRFRNSRITTDREALKITMKKPNFHHHPMHRLDITLRIILLSKTHVQVKTEFIFGRKVIDQLPQVWLPGHR